MNAHTPHPERELAQRISSRIEAIKAANPNVSFWTPLNSPSGKWEAEGPDWVIMERSPSRYAAQLEAKLPPPAPPENVPGGSSENPTLSPAPPGDPQ